MGVWDLANLFFSNNIKDKPYYEEVFNHLDNYQPVDESVEHLLGSLKRNKLLRELSIKSFEVVEGHSQYKEVEELLSQLEPLQVLSNISQTEFISDDLEALLEETVNRPGLNWRLEYLNESLGPLRQGDFGFVFSRPEGGKTTFLASEGSFMLPQTDKPILHFNNEEQGNKVMLRYYQAYFGVTLEQLYGNPKYYRDLFKEQTGGRLKLFDSAKIDWRTVEKITKELCPGLIIIDQIDKIQGFDSEREDLLLGRIYRWARELAKTYCPVIGVTQADGSGEGVRWLSMANVANAKTAKQAEADFILGIGSIHESGWDDIRFINISKNKLSGGPHTNSTNRHGKFECVIYPEIARYGSIKT